METRRLSDLIAALRKGDGNGCRHANALMQEAADALMANQGAIVNSIIERTRHEATDDEREALLMEARRAQRAVFLATDADVAEDLSRIIRGLADALEACSRRSEVPEPSAEELAALEAVRGWTQSSGPGVRVLRVLLAMAERAVYQKGYDDAK